MFETIGDVLTATSRMSHSSNIFNDPFTSLNHPSCPYQENRIQMFKLAVWRAQAWVDLPSCFSLACLDHPRIVSYAQEGRMIFHPSYQALPPICSETETEKSPMRSKLSSISVIGWLQLLEEHTSSWCRRSTASSHQKILFLAVELWEQVWGPCSLYSGH